LSLVPNAHADLRVKSKYTASGQSSETTIYTRGARQRFEPAMGIAIINQNDVKRTVQIFDDKKMYMIMSPEMLAGAPPEAQPQATPPPATAKGGVVNVTIAVNDTGERKQMFGYMARHVKNTVTRVAGPDTCDPGSDTIDTDGWYIDYTPEAGATTPPSSSAAPTPTTAASCKDDVRVNQTGTGTVGYPLAYTVKTTKDGKAVEMSMEVVEFSPSPLDAALFEVPAGYAEVKGFAGLSAMLAGGAPSASGAPAAASPAAGQPALTPTASGFIMPKVPGTVRVGVADIGNRAGRNLGAASPRDQLVSELLNAKVDAVSLTGSSVPEVEAAAKKLEADYILYSEVTEVKKAGGGLGGLMSKASAITSGGTAQEKLEAKVDYRLAPIDGSKPILTASAKGTNGAGGLGVPGALGLASNVMGFGMLARMGMFNPNMLKLFGNMGAGMGGGMGAMGAMMNVPGMPRGGLDPGLSPFVTAMSATQVAMTPPQPTEDGKAVMDAFGDTAKKVAEALNKKKK